MKQTSTIEFHTGTVYVGTARKFIARLFLALCVMAVGVGYIGNAVSVCPWENFTLFFPGWGALFLIIPSIYFLLRNRWSWFWVPCLCGGLLILLPRLEVLPRKDLWIMIGGGLLILLGLRILLNPIFKKWETRRARKQWKNMISENAAFSDVDTVGADGADYAVRFSSHRYDMKDQPFTYATLSVQFGELVFDLSGADVQNNSVIDATCSFGDLTILLPPDVRAEVKANCNLGGCKNNRCTAPEGAPTVYISANCSFGDIKVR